MPNITPRMERATQKGWSVTLGPLKKISEESEGVLRGRPIILLCPVEDGGTF